MNTPIKNPCSENWNEMSEQAQGRMCAHCQKCVIDFTQMSDGEVIAYIKMKKEEKICGRMSYTQIERFRLKKLQPSPRKWSKPMAAAFAALLATVPLQYVSAQEPSTNPIEIQMPKDTPPKEDVQKKEKAGRMLEGKVVSSFSGETPVADALVEVKGTKVWTKTDAKGHFSLDLSKIPNVKEGITILVKHHGYQSSQSIYTYQDLVSGTPLIISLFLEEEMFMGDIDVEFWDE